jgi:hypothetical protein
LHLALGMLAFRVLLKLIFVFTLFSCDRNISLTPTQQDQANALAALTVLQVTAANPSSGNTIIDEVTATAKRAGPDTVLVTLSKIISGNRHEVHVYFSASTASVSQLSYSWIVGGNLYGAFSNSPAGVSVDLSNKKISLQNSLLNSGLPTTATLNGQFYFVGP